MASSFVEPRNTHSSEFATSLVRMQGSKRARVHFGPVEIFCGAKYEGGDVDDRPQKWKGQSRGKKSEGSVDAVLRKKDTGFGSWNEGDWSASRGHKGFGRRARKVRVRVRRLLSCFLAGWSSASGE